MDDDERGTPGGPGWRGPGASGSGSGGSGRDLTPPPTIRVYGWQWGGEDQRRQGPPWIGVFLVVFGLLILLERFVPQLQFAGSAFLLAVGIVFLLRWAVERGLGSLYAGAIITALALPGTLEGLGVAGGEGLGTLCLGLAFLFIALVRWRATGGIGWQAWFGGILAAIGLARFAVPGLGALFFPLVLVAIGALLVFRGLDRG